MHARKTGAMIAVSLVLGGMTAGADSPQVEALARYGRSLGLAFQIVDDLLDVRGHESVMGKRARKDCEAGKLTYPGLLGVEASFRRAEQLVTEACQAVDPLGPRAVGLTRLARYVLERNH
jgi:geranylgeranyl diphosphate synthase type II